MAFKGAYCRSVSLVGFKETVEQFGGDVKSLLEEVGLSQDVLTNVDSFYEYNKGVALAEVAANRLGVPNFGLHWALNVPDHFSNCGPALYLSLIEKSARTWTESMIKYRFSHTNGDEFSLIEKEDEDFSTFRFQLTSGLFVGRQYCEFVAALFVRLGAKVIGPQSAPFVGRFQHSKPEDLTLHHQIFGDILEFDAEFNECCVQRSMFDTKLPEKIGFIKPIINLYMQFRLKHMPEYTATVSETCELLIKCMIGTRACNIDNVSESLGVNRKKLQRLLEEEDTNFSVIYEDVREEIAKRMLIQSSAPISNIAGLLDYSSTPPFTLAFRRWTGQSPLEYRKRSQMAMESI